MIKQIDGKDFQITEAGFFDAMSLKKALSDALRQGGIKFDLSGFNIGESMEDTEIGDIGGILDMLLSVATDPEVRTWLFKCSEKALFNKQKVDADFFEKPENRQYYYPIMLEILRVNLSPFFGKLNSSLSNLPGLKGLFRKQK